MDSIIIPWADESGDNLYISRNGESVEITSDANWGGEARSQILTFATTVGSISTQVEVAQGVGEDGIVVVRGGVIASFGGVIPLYKASGELPYIPLKWIESTGVQYISTGMNATNNATYEMTFIKDNGATGSLFGGNIPQSGIPYGGLAIGFWVGSAGPLNGVAFTIAQGQQHTLSVNVSGQVLTRSLDGDEASATFAGNAFGGKDIAIFCQMHDLPIQGTAMKLYSWKRYDGDTFVQDFIPCKLKATGEVGMWDLVSDTFFGNLGADEFIAGDDLYPYIPLEYIQSSGTQWIDTLQTIRQDLQTNIKFAMVDGYSNQSLFGAWVAYYGYRCIYYGGQYWFTTGSQTQVHYPYPEPSDIRNIVFNNTEHSATIDDDIYPINYTTISVEDDIYLFCCNRGVPNELSRMKLYEFSMVSNITGEVFLNLIPCMRKSDNVVCLYDTVSGEFFENQGTGDFIAGSPQNEALNSLGILSDSTTDQQNAQLLTMGIDPISI